MLLNSEAEETQQIHGIKHYRFVIYGLHHFFTTGRDSVIFIPNLGKVTGDMVIRISVGWDSDRVLKRHIS
jgi:hypothetical protein